MFPLKVDLTQIPGLRSMICWPEKHFKEHIVKSGPTESKSHPALQNSKSLPNLMRLTAFTIKSDKAHHI